MTESTLLDRYQARRTRRFLDHQSRTSSWLPNWRTQRRRRVLVVTILTALMLWLVISVLTMINRDFSALLIPVGLVFFATWTMLQTVTGRAGDAPRDSLDEWELQRRNIARSIGLTITGTLVAPAAAVAVYVPILVDTDRDFTIGCGQLVIGALLLGACSPAMILGWTTPDPDPDPIS